MEPTTIVEVMNADTTPNAKAKPNERTGGKGDTTFDRKAATVVMTVKVSARYNSFSANAHASGVSAPSDLRFS